MLGCLNARYEFGPAAPTSDTYETECLIKVFATKPIKAGSEILVNYGDDYWV